jgi:tRNA (guanine37-N1)-methyltransferase
MRINVFTLFPEVFQPYLETSILHRAIQSQLVQVNLYNIREWATDRHHVTDDEPEISIGDYVLSGGELPAMVLIDAIVRLLPGALGDPNGALDDSHASGLLEYPHYTRPSEFRGWGVPEVLTSGDHARVARWRREQALLRTYLRRPDLLASAELSDEDRAFLEKFTQDKALKDQPTDERN